MISFANLNFIFIPRKVLISPKDRIFRLVYEASELGAPRTQLTLLEMAVALQPLLGLRLEAARGLKFPPGCLDEAGIGNLCSDAAMRVITRYGGLLEIQRQATIGHYAPGLEISYLHRTVKDYSTTPKRSDGPPGSDKPQRAD